MNPDDLDAMDECIPFTKFTLDNLLGYESNADSYRHYFEGFRQAQHAWASMEPKQNQLEE